MTGSPYEQWSYVIHVGFDAAFVSPQVNSATRVVTSSGGAASPTGGASTRLESSTFLTSIPLEEAMVIYSPADFYSVSVGRQRVPFSVGNSVIITRQMFPTRPGPTDVFMTGPDDGLVNRFRFLDERILASAGIFNGSSLGLQLPGTTTVGPVWSAFLDVQPLGKMPPREGDQNRGPFRFAIGIGSLYRRGTLFDGKGYQATRFQDLRISSAARLAFWGLFVQAEVLRRLQTDDLSSRPASATGAYAQSSYYFKVRRTIALGPLARFGISVQDEAFAPQKTTSVEGGIAFYPRADHPEPDVVRIIGEFVHEARSPSGEKSNGGVLHMQLRF